MDFGWDMGGGDWLGPILVLILVGVVVYFASRTMALRGLRRRPATPPSPRPYMTPAPIQPAPAPPAAVAPLTLRDRLAQLDEVKQEGLITQEEYDTARAGILHGVTQGPPPAP